MDVAYELYMQQRNRYDQAEGLNVVQTEDWTWVLIVTLQKLILQQINIFPVKKQKGPVILDSLFNTFAAGQCSPIQTDQ